MNEMKYFTAPKTVPLAAEAFMPSEKTTIYWLGGAGFFINARGTLIMIDPILKTMPGKPDYSEIEYKLKVDLPIESKEVPRLDLLLYTHSDIDHLAIGTAKDLLKLKPKVVGPSPVYEKLTKNEADPKTIEICRPGDRIHIDDILIEVTVADHPWQLLNTKVYGKPFRIGDCCGFILNTPDGRFYLPGDTRLMEEHLLISDIDVLALDASVDTYHLNHYGASELANSLKEARLIPYHYGTFDVPGHLAHCGDPRDLLANIDNGNLRGKIYAPGEAIVL